MFFWNKFCGVFLFLLITGLCSPAQSTTCLRKNTPLQVVNSSNSKGFAIHFLPPITGLYNIKRILPANFYSCNIGFFCKKELLIEKATKIPIRFRLGSLQQCNYYEGKGGNGNRQYGISNKQ
jgi:hypothetical protein